MTILKQKINKLFAYMGYFPKGEIYQPIIITQNKNIQLFQNAREFDFNDYFSKGNSMNLDDILSKNPWLVEQINLMKQEISEEIIDNNIEIISFVAGGMLRIKAQIYIANKRQ